MDKSPIFVQYHVAKLHRFHMADSWPARKIAEAHASQGRLCNQENELLTFPFTPWGAAPVRRGERVFIILGIAAAIEKHNGPYRNE